MSCPEDRLWREEYRKLLGDDSDHHHAISDEYYRQNGIVPSGVKLPRFFYRNETEEEEDPNATKSDDDMWSESELKDCLQKCRPILLDKIEKQLYRGEELYFQETDGYGNIFRGWMDTLDTTKVPDNLATMDNSNSNKRMPLDYRWFSTQTRPTKTTRSTSSSSNITNSGITTNHHPNTSSWKQSSYSNIATPNTRTGNKIEQPALRRSASLPKNIKATNKEDHTIKVEQKKKKKTSTTSSNYHVRESKSNQEVSRDKSSILKKSVSSSSLKRTNSTGNMSSASNRKSNKRSSTSSSSNTTNQLDDNDTNSKGKKETSSSTESTDSKSRSSTQQETTTATSANNTSPKNQLEFTIPRKKKLTTSVSQQQSSESTNPSILENIPRKIRSPSNPSANHSNSNSNSNQKNKSRKRKSIENASSES